MKFAVRASMYWNALMTTVTPAATVTPLGELPPVTVAVTPDWSTHARSLLPGAPAGSQCEPSPQFPLPPVQVLSQGGSCAAAVVAKTARSAVAASNERKAATMETRVSP